MNKRPLSLRSILWLTVATLTLLIGLLAAQQIYARLQQLRNVESLKGAVTLSDKLFDATGKLSTERDIAFTMLHAADSGDVADLTRRLQDSRRDTDSAFGDALLSMTQYNFPELAELRTHIETHLAGIKNTRRDIDGAMLKSDKPARAALAAHWYGQVKGLTAEVEDLWIIFVGHFTNIDPVVTQHLRYTHFLRIINDYTGRERALIGRLLVENADSTPEETGQLLRWQGIIELSWKCVHLLADQSGLSGQIGPSLKDAESQYLNMYDMVHDIFYVPGAAHGNAYPIDVNLWFELSAQSADALAQLRDASRKAKQDFIGGLERDSEHAIALCLAILLFAFSLCAYCFWTINRRVIGPINAIVEALLRTMQGQTVPAAPFAANGQDEIAKLARVLHAFQQNMEEIRRSNQDLEDFAYIASHDLKEPLHGLSKNASFLMEDYKERLDAGGVHKLHRLVSLAQRMEHLISDLLYFSRLGRAGLAIQETDLNQVVEDIRDMMDAYLKERNARIMVPVPLPTIICDKPGITEVLRNLITNGVKYNDKDERIVEIGFSDEMPAAQGTEKNVIHVRDNGIGIHPQFHAEIFRIFKKLQTTPENDKSTGVGLTFVKKIVERHKGRIWLDSTPGSGSVFYFNCGIH